jgi:hypothetical protein
MAPVEAEDVAAASPILLANEDFASLALNSAVSDTALESAKDEGIDESVSKKQCEWQGAARKQER